MRASIGKAASARGSFSQETCQLPGTGRDSGSRVIGRTVLWLLTPSVLLQGGVLCVCFSCYYVKNTNWARENAQTVVHRKRRKRI